MKKIDIKNALVNSNIRQRFYEKVDDFEKYISFYTLYKINKVYNGNISNYKAALASFTKRPRTRVDYRNMNNFIYNFQLECDSVLKIIGNQNINGKPVRIANLVLDEVKKRGIIKKINNRNINYPSGKTFTCCRSYYLVPEEAEKLIANKDAYDLNSDFYTKRQIKLILKYYFGIKLDMNILRRLNKWVPDDDALEYVDNLNKQLGFTLNLDKII